MALRSGRAVVTTPGTPVPLSVEPFYEGDTVCVQAFKDNSDVVVIGDRNVVADQSGRIGLALEGTDRPVTLGDQNSPVRPGEVWVDAVVGGEGVTWVAV